MKISNLIVLLLVCMFGSAQVVFAQDEVDHLALATTLAADGHFDRAKLALKSVNLEDKNLDKQNFHLVSGLVDLNTQDWKSAIKHFKLLIEGSEKKADTPVYFEYYAQALYGDGQYSAALRNVEKVGPAANKNPGIWLLKIDSLTKLKRNEEAWTSINSAEKYLPDDIRFVRIKVQFLLELGLFSSAAQAAEKLMKHPKATAEDALALGEGLRKGGALKGAILFLEGARIRFPEKGNTKMSALLAYCYAQDGKYLAAAELLSIAAEDDDKFRIESAEMYIKAGKMSQAMYQNGLVQEQKSKLRQRVAILVDLGQYEKISALYPRLKRLKVLEDDALRYAVAYAQFQTADLRASLVTLKGIKDSNYFDSATKLREIIIRCQKNETCLN